MLTSALSSPDVFSELAACVSLTPQKASKAHNRYRVNEDVWTERKSDSDTTQATQTGDSPEVPGSGEQGTLYCRAVQDLFFMKPLLSRAEGVADFPNKEKLTQIDKMRKQRNMSQMKKQDKITAGD